MKTPNISVVLSTYNHELFLAQSLESILEQTYQDFEIIIVDDGSSYEISKILKSFRQPKIRFISNARLGVSCSVNSAIDLCRGQYIALMSGDDLCYPNRLELQLNQSLIGEFLFFSRPTIIDWAGNKILSPELPFWNFKFDSIPNQLKYLLENGNSLCAPTLFAKKETLAKIGKFDASLLQLQDFDYWLRALSTGIGLHLSNEKHIYYRWSQPYNNQFPANLSGHSNVARIDYELSKVYKNFFGNFDINCFNEIYKNKLRFFLEDVRLSYYLNLYLVLGGYNNSKIQKVSTELLDEYISRNLTLKESKTNDYLASLFSITNKC